MNRVLVILISVSAMLLINYNFYVFVESGYIVLFYLIKILIIALMFGLVLNGLKNLMRSRDPKTGIRLSILTFFAFLLIVELIFTFFSRSHHAEMSYASIIWHNRYYKLNSDGFRDVEFNDKDTSRPALVFLGDSYSAGYGLDNTANRYSDIVGNTLKSDYEFYNMGVKATGLIYHKTLIGSVPNRKKVLIYQVYLNDLDEYCLEAGKELPDLDIYKNFSALDKYWARSFFLINYIYFSFPNEALIRRYYGFYSSCSSDPEIYKNYFIDLKNMFIKAHDECGYEKVVVILMPTLADLSFCKSFEQKVLYGIADIPYVRYIQPSAFIENIPIKERIVNKQDTHASSQVNKLIANKLLDLM